MKNKIIVYALLGLSLTLSGCSRRGAVNTDDTKTNTLAPQGETLSGDVAVARLGEAYKSMMGQDNVSFLLNTTSDPLPNFSFSSTDDDVYTNGKEKATIARTGTFSGLSSFASFSGLASSKADDVKASIVNGWNASTSYKTNDEAVKEYKTTGISSKSYFADKTFYFGPNNTKFGTFLTNNLIALGMNESYRAILLGLLSQKYKVSVPLTDSNMPLINTTVLGTVDKIISTLNTHSAEYASFLKGYTLKDGNYALHVSMSKNDVIKVAHDLVDDAKESLSSLSVDSSSIDTSLKDLSVKSLEFLVTFSQSSVLSCTSSFEVSNKTTTDLYDLSSLADALKSAPTSSKQVKNADSSSSSSSSSSPSLSFPSIGTRSISYDLKGYLSFSFGEEAPVLPSSDELAAYKDLGQSISDIVGGILTKL